MHPPRLLLIHGWGSNASVWLRQLPLSGEFETEAIDLPGHGAPEPWDRPDFGPGIRRAEKALADGRPTLVVGWSLGAMIALAVAARPPSSLCGVVAVGATPSFVRRDRFPHGVSRALVVRMKKDLLRDMDGALDRFHALNFSEAERNDPAYPEWIESLPKAPRDLAGEDLARCLDALIHADLRAGLSLIDCPVLLIHGTADGVCPYPAAEWLRDAVPGSRLVTEEGAGHAPFVTRAEAFNRRLREFAIETVNR